MKKSYLLLLLAMLPVLAIAQKEVINTLVADFERAKSLSLAYVDAMPEDKFSFKPTEEIRSYAQQFLHASQGLIGLSANGTGADRIYANVFLEKDSTLQTKAEVIRIVTESFDYAIESIRKMDSSTFDEIVERGPFKVTKLGWVNKSFEHLVHHRGQCAIYLRLSGATPPEFKLF